MKKVDVAVLIGFVAFIVFILPVFAYMGLMYLITEQNAKDAASINQSSVETSSNESGVFDTFEYTALVASVEITRCTNLTGEEIVVPETIDGKDVTTLGDRSFYQLTQVKEILLPENLFAIEDGAFYRCYNLRKMHIPSSVEHIGNNPFFRCSSLTEITVAEDNKRFTAQDGVLYNKDMTMLIAYPEGKTRETYVLPETVTALGVDAFGYASPLKKIYLHENVTEGLENMRGTFQENVIFYVKAGSPAEQFAAGDATPIQYEVY